jgi:hypothetical protein
MNRTSKLGSTSTSESLNSSYTPPSENASPLDSSSHHGSAAGLHDTAESFGRISMDEEQPNYVGSTHWAAILDNVSMFL